MSSKVENDDDDDRSISLHDHDSAFFPPCQLSVHADLQSHTPHKTIQQEIAPNPPIKKINK